MASSSCAPRPLDGSPPKRSRSVTPVFLLLLSTALAARAADADEWSFTPKTADDAALVASYGLYSTRILELRPSYRHIQSGGYAVALGIRLAIPMPYVLVPGLRLGDIYSIVRVELPVVRLSVPGARATGIGDVHVLDGAVKSFHWGAVGFGFGTVLPAATDKLLGFGKLQLGPAAGISVWLTHGLSASLILENLFSVTGEDGRPDVDTLYVQPAVLWNLPHALFVEFEPTWSFDWTRGGYATLPLDLAFGHGFTPHFVLSVEPEWTVIGTGRNDVLVRMWVSYLGW